MPVAANMTLAALGAFCCWLSAQSCARIGTRASHDRKPCNQDVWSLSGRRPSFGRQSTKTRAGQVASTSAEIFLLDEPTQGVDVGAKEEIYRLIRDMSASGKAILVVSSDLEEVLEIGDRVFAIRRGRVRRRIPRRRSRPDATGRCHYPWACGMTGSHDAKNDGPTCSSA